MRGLNLAAVLLLLSLASPPANAGIRSERWSGFDLCAGTPFPSVVGLMLGFNTGDDARISIGTGSFGNWATYQLDAKVFLAPTPWAAYFGTGLDYMVGTHGEFAFWNLPFDRTFVPYLEVGLDFQSDVGIHVTFNLGGAAPNGQLIILPGLAIGWYF